MNSIRKGVACAIVVTGLALSNAHAVVMVPANDAVSGVVGVAGGLQGEFWDVSTNQSTIATARSSVAGVMPTATFVATHLDYPAGADVVLEDNDAARIYILPAPDVLMLVGIGIFLIGAVGFLRR